MIFKIKATAFVISLFILSLLTGIAAGIALEKDITARLLKTQREYYEQQLRLTKEVLKIMLDNQCTDPVIFETIMETFDPPLIAKVIAAESGYQIDCISSKNCRGLMQLSSDKLDDWKDVKKNIRIGAQYLRDQMHRFGDLKLAIAAYNAGPENIVKFGGVPDYKETREYIERLRAMGVQI